MNLVLEVPTKLPSSLGLYSVHRVKMVSKDVPPVIELLDEEEEEWPDAGAQNPEEAQQYVNKINNIFDHLSELIHEDKKDALGDDHPTLQNVDHETVGDDGRCGCQCCSPHHKGPCHSLSLTTSHQGRSRCLRSSRRFSVWARVYLTVTRANTTSRRNGLHHSNI